MEYKVYYTKPGSKRGRYFECVADSPEEAVEKFRIFIDKPGRVFKQRFVGWVYEKDAKGHWQRV